MATKADVEKKVEDMVTDAKAILANLGQDLDNLIARAQNEFATVESRSMAVSDVVQGLTNHYNAVKAFIDKHEKVDK